MKTFLRALGYRINSDLNENQVADLLGITTDAVMTALKLYSLGIGPKTSVKIASELSLEEIKGNPYCIVACNGVGFKTADKLASMLHIDTNSFLRIKELVKYVLLDRARSNHDLFVPLNELDKACKEIGGISCARYVHKIEDVVLEGDRVYLKEYYNAEWEVARKLCNMARTMTGNNKVIDSPVSIITGIPGSGKTTLIGRIAPMFNSVVLCPTGRAARRVKEATGIEAFTIHKFLAKPRAVDCVILDESSMIDIMLFRQILEIDPKKIIIIGDPHQLDSVSAGSILLPLIDSGVFPVQTLTNNFRSGSGIITNAVRVLNRAAPTIMTHDFSFIECDEKLAFQRILEYSKYISPWELQVLSPMKKGLCGTENLNKSIKEIVGGGKVIVTKNDYRFDVRNGEIGKIVGEDRMPLVEIEGEIKRVPRWLLDDAYAITVHKMQGSECDVIVFPVLVKHYVLLSRNLVYTGITRAKKQCIVLGEKKALWIAARKEESMAHNTLAERIRSVWKEMMSKGQ